MRKNTAPGPRQGAKCPLSSMSCSRGARFSRDVLLVPFVTPAGASDAGERDSLERCPHGRPDGRWLPQRARGLGKRRGGGGCREWGRRGRRDARPGWRRGGGGL
ncbi:hypothetical protein F0U59_20140 [Archangium gephyra]|nr:hypothetical protein F0U59_20140 [Archangium gephyra]